MNKENNENNENPDNFGSNNIACNESGITAEELKVKAYRLIESLGVTIDALNQFMEMADQCNAPFSKKGLQDIWLEAIEDSTATSNEDQAPLEETETEDNEENSEAEKTAKAKKAKDAKKKKNQILKSKRLSRYLCEHQPRDSSDISEAKVFQEYYYNRVLYCNLIGFMEYRNVNGEDVGPWIPSEKRLINSIDELTEIQMQEAMEAHDELVREIKSKFNIRETKPGEFKGSDFVTSEEAKEYYETLERLKEFYKYAVARRNHTGLNGFIEVLKTLLAVDAKKLDSAPHLLCTPAGTVDLREGIKSIRENDSKDLITKITAVAPGIDGADEWNDFLYTIFQGDIELIDYMQELIGLAVIGRVYFEGIIFVYGSGRNGKSTFFNLIARVLGNYSGTISPEILSKNVRFNIRPLLATMQGKRLLIAPELPKGSELNDGTLKQISSKDDINVERKYKDPISFKPSHTIFVPCNHLMKLNAFDIGTKRRVIVVPFNAKISSTEDIKDYEDYLFRVAGSYVLTWIIEGAQKVEAMFDLDHDGGHGDIPMPTAVKEATDQYFAEQEAEKNQSSVNAQIYEFLWSKCERGTEYTISSNVLYNEYLNWCEESGRKPGRSESFYQVLKASGCTIESGENRRHYLRGVQLKN